MPNWKKLIVSGSDATLRSLNVSNAVTASFFTGDGSGLTNLPSSSGFPFTGSAEITGSLKVVGPVAISGSLNMSGSISRANFIDFNTEFSATQPVAGRLSWNNSDGTLDLGLKDNSVTLQLGQETLYEIRNETTSSIPKGTSLFANGVTAGSGRITAAPFVADGNTREVRYLGLATEDISTGINGFVTHFGYVRGLDTRGTAPSSIAVGDENWSVGDILYAHPTVPGKLTNIRPKHEIIVAIIIIRHQSTGVIFVRPSSFGHLDDIHDVNINTGSLSSGDLLVYDSGTDYWGNTKQLTGSYGLTGSLEATSFTGSLLGTASFATTASFALTGITPTLQQVVNTGNGISNYNGNGVASIQSTNFTNNRTLYLNDNSYPTIRLVDNFNASNNLQIDIDTLSLDGVSYNWSDIVSGGGSIDTGSLLKTGSVAGNVLTFTKGDSTTFSLTVATGSGGGGGGATAIHTQAVAANTWTFNHNLNTLTPLLQVYDLGYEQIIPNEIVSINAFTSEIRFDYTQAGYAVASTGGGLIITGSTAKLIQTAPATTWSFAHNLGSKYPGFEVFNENDDVVIPAGIHVIDENNAEIYFAIPSTGVAIANFSGIDGVFPSSSYAFTASYSDEFYIGQTQTEYATVASSINGSNTIFNQATGSYTSAFFKYTVAKGVNARSGEIMSVWNGTTVAFTDNSTTDIGSTTPVTASVVISGANVRLNIQTNTSGWKVKSIATFM
jgi:hypothetical protein